MCPYMVIMRCGNVVADLHHALQDDTEVGPRLTLGDNDATGLAVDQLETVQDTLHHRGVHILVRPDLGQNTPRLLPLEHRLEAPKVFLE